MKIPSVSRGILIFFMAFLCGIQVLLAQSDSSGSKKSKNPTEGLVNMQDYSFRAQTALPMGGRSIMLTGDYYFLSVSKDSVVSFLPYYGRAYTAPLNPSSGNGIEFTSTKFDYTVEPKKKGGWDITIKPQDLQNAQDVSEMHLSISSSGYASLQVISVNRQAINFNGEVTARRHKK